MAGSSVIQAAITALRKATGNDKKHKARLNNIRDAFKQVEADGVPNAEHCTHLVQVLSDDIPALYASRAQPTLVFCGAALGWLFKARLEPALEVQNSESVNVWENTIFRGLMQPILNMIDSDGPGDIGTALYKEMCGMMRSLWSDRFGGRFARSLALVLIYTCTTSKNKAMLLDSNILGITALAKLILDAKDYHHLDTLLELSFTMFSSQGGKVSRKAYADSIFASPYALEKLPDSICNELASIHAVTSGDNSEKHILDMMCTMSSGGIERPQVFVTRGLSYCGMAYSQKSPSNVMILDYASVCLVICDKDGENDVLTVPLTGIQSVELNPDNSRILVEFIIAEAPLISSTRESVATPDDHPAESPLRLRVSIASSDVFGLEAALAARNLAGVLSSQSVLTHNSSLASTKISQAVSSVALKKTDHTEAEELLRKHVNLPSSTSESSPGPVLFKSRVAAQTRARNSPVPSEQPAAPAPIHMQPQQVKPVKSRPARVQPTEPVPPPAHEKAPSVPLANSPVSEKRPPRDRVEEVAFGLDNSELTDADLDRDITAKSPLSETDGGEVQRAVESPPEAQNAPLPTPPRTRSRAQQTKPIAKTLVPATPVQDSPVSDLTSPSPKPTRKRKLAEEDPIELPPLDHATKDDIPPASQGILPRTTAATRAKAQYGATAKRIRVSSPPESIQSTDNEEVVSPERTPAHEAPDAVTADENVPPRPDKKRLAPPGKRLTRAAANKETDPAFSKAPAKTKPVSGRGVSNDEPELAILEKPKPRRGRPPKNKAAQKQGATIPPKDQIRPQLPIELPALEQRNPPRTYAAHPKTSPAAAPDGVGKEDSEGDELLQRLSQAAKKATRTPFVEEPRALSPSKPVGFPFEDEHVDVESVDPSEPIADLLPAQPESIRSQKHVDTTKGIKNVEATLDAKPSMSRRTKETKSPNAPSRFTKNASSLGAPEEVTHVQDPVNVVSTKAITPQDIRIEDSGEDAPMGDIATKGSRIPNSLNSAERKQEQPRTPVLDLAPKPTFAEVPGTPLVQEDPEVVALPKTPLQGKSHGATKRIYPARVQPADQTTPRRDATQSRQVNLQPVRSRIEYISVDSTNTDTQMDGLEDRAPPRAQPQHAGHPSLIVTPTVHSTRQQPSRSRPEPSRATHPAVTRVLFSNQPSPKSALASPVKRTLNNGARPSVSFLDPPAGTLLRRGSSGSSAGAEKRKQQDFERERLLEGKSARTGSVIMNIVDALDRIQAAVVSNIGEKVQAVTTEARSARAELIKIVVAELDSLVSEAEVHRNALHDLEGMFASQAQALLEGLDRLGDRNTQVLVRAEKMLEKNARAGRGVSENVVNFELPDVFAAFVAE